jgi:GntR family transcriptional regulator
MFSIDVQSRVPIYEQIVNQVERFIVTGILKSNEQLPSVRQIAFDLGINPNTIQRAYTELERREVIVSVVGKGSFVTDDIHLIVDKKINEVLDRVKDDLNILKNLGLSNEEIQEKIFKD